AHPLNNFWKKEKQESHSLCEVWPSQLLHPEEPLLHLCLPRRSQVGLQLACEGNP
ncbi:unnamed protein product, partial [Eruca vesicaria subsp. sativa]|nr:unnamed protein product [Eruca vesicaria subsp. sativa]